MTTMTQCYHEAMEIEVEITKLLCVLAARSLLPVYKWKPWERKKIEKKINTLSCELQEKRLHILKLLVDGKEKFTWNLRNGR